MAANTKTDVFEAAILKLIFQNIDTATSAGPAIGDAGGLRGSATAGSLYVSLHTADPGEAAASGQSTSEIAYTGYARVAVARTAAAWPLNVSTINPAAAITFGQMTAGAGGTVTHAGIGTLTSGNGHLLYSGAVTPTISVVNGVTPSLTTLSTIVED